MFQKRKYDRSGLYKTGNNIKDFSFRIQIKAIFSLIEIPDFGQSNSNDRRPRSKEGQRNLHNDIFECRWQQSKSELTAHLDEGQDAVPTVEEVRGTRQVRVFTVCHEEEKVGRVGEGGGDDGKAKESGAAAAARTLDGLFEWYPMKQEDRPRGGQGMKVMAELGEQIVCLVEMTAKDGNLFIYPDFNQLDDNPYLIEFDRKAKGQMILYAIEPIKKVKEATRRNGLSKEKAMVHSKPLGIIQSPKHNHFKALLLFTFITAEAFDYDNLHFKYTLSRNNRTAQPPTILLTSATHSVSRGDNGVFNISHCFEHALEVAYEDVIVDDQSTATAASVQMVIEGYSVDTWQRERYHGFSSIAIPLTMASSFERRTMSFVMEQNSLVEQLQRFFIGGHKRLSHRDQSATNMMYGNTVKSSGSLKVAYSLIIQQDPAGRRSTGGGIEARQRNSLLKDVDAIIHDFKRSCSLVKFE